MDQFELRRRAARAANGYLPFGPDPGREGWVIVATDRRAERNAAIFALGANGDLIEGPDAGRFATRAAAEAAVRRWREAGRLEDSRWTYTALRVS